MSTAKNCVHLLSGYDMPLVGVGTYKVRGREVIKRVIDESLAVGFRSIDTAVVYRNEEDIGLALQELLPKYNLKREDLFITSKLAPSDNGDPDRIRKCVEDSLKALKTSYLDLYLIHWPGAARILENSTDNPKLRITTWTTLVELKQQGLLRSIGVSNYNVKHLKHLLDNCNGVVPDVNQVECHPHFRQDELIEYCTKKGIHVQAYSSLGTSDTTSLLEDPLVKKVASELNVSPARVLLKWALQRELGIIPKAIKSDHIKDNIQLDFEINEDQMKLLSNLPQQKYSWNPDNVINLVKKIVEAMHNLEDKIAKLCLDKYTSLKKTGKPSDNEWTVLSGVVLQHTSKELCVVSLCTGTKCLSGKELLSAKYVDRGNKLSDSHAEILARRAFLRYLYRQIDLVINNQKNDVFYLENNDIKLKDVSFHFFSSQTPCGDCSIIPKFMEGTDDFVSPPKKTKKEEESDASQVGQAIADIYRTGAKCLENNERQDPLQEGVNYHIVGPLRTKPGRGDRTLSLSCSDKLAKWNVMGVQGALLSLMIPTIRFKSIVIGGGCPYSLESMQRGIFQRFDPNIKAPVIVQSQLTFEHIKKDIRTKPCPSSIVWCLVPEKSIEIAVNGLRQGATKKVNKSFNLLISRKEIFKTFLTLYDKFLKDKKGPQHPKKITYYHCKQYSTTYQNLRREKSTVFSMWPTKPLHLQELAF